MTCHLEAADLGVWRVTRDGMKPIKNLDKPTKSEEKEITTRNPSFYDKNPHDGANFGHIIYHNMTQKSIAS